MWSILLHFTLRSVTSIEALFTDLLLLWQKIDRYSARDKRAYWQSKERLQQLSDCKKCPFECLCWIDFLCYKVCGVRAFISFSQQAFSFQLAQCNNLTKQMYFQKNNASLTPQMKGFISEYTKSVRTTQGLWKEASITRAHQGGSVNWPAEFISDLERGKYSKILKV